MDVYVEVSRQIRALMEDLTPAVEPLSLDEAFLDLSGTARLHHAPPAVLLARLVRRIETEIGIEASIGLSHNKFLAKVASDLDKPRGFSVIGRAETAAFLRDRPVSLIWGVGQVSAARLEAAGIRTFADLLRWDRRDLAHRFGSEGDRLWRLARGEDARPVRRDRGVKSVSNETTFDDDTGDADLLDGHIWRLSEKVADRLKARDLAGRVVTLKLKRSDFAMLTRRISLGQPTQIADRIYRTARGLFAEVAPQGPVPPDRRRPVGDRARGRGRRGLRPPRPRRPSAGAGRARGRRDPRPVRPGRDRQGPGAALSYSAASGIASRPIAAIRATTPSIRRRTAAKPGCGAIVRSSM